MTHSNKDSGGTVAELRALLEKASPGPWANGGVVCVDGEDFDYNGYLENATATLMRPGVNNRRASEDVQLAAALRNAAHDLLRVVEAAQAVYNGALRHEHTYYVSPGSIARLGDALDKIIGGAT